MEIRSVRCRLRRFCLEDFSNMRLLESDPDVMRFTPMRVPLTEEKTRERLAAVVAKETERGDLGVWAAELFSGEFVGWFMLLKTELEGPELGFMMVQKYWGQGLASEISSALVEYAFRILKLPKLFAVTDPDNAVSMRVLQKIGFRYVRNRENSASKVFELKA